MRDIKKITALAVIACTLLSGCGVGISMSDKDVNIESSVGIFNQHTSYYDNYSAEQDETTCKVKGRLHQSADDQNDIITYVTAQDGTGSMTVTGSMNCTKGSLRLVYMAPDGTETLISDGTGRKIEAQVDVAEGEGNIGFVSDGQSSVCEFNIKAEAGDGVTFANIMKEEEIIEDEQTIPQLKSQEEIVRDEKFEEKSDWSKKPEKPSKFSEVESESMLESVEEMEGIDEDLEDFHLDEIENNWPESIRYSSDGVYANPMIVSFEIDEPMTLSVACVTTGGKLRLKIVDDVSFGNTVYFDETDPNGTYTVDIDKKGTYQMLLYAKYHAGSVEIAPVKP